MQKKYTTQAHITPEIVCKASCRLQEVTPLKGYQLEVTFIDGTHGIVDMKPLIMGHKAGVFAKLREIPLFNQVQLVFGVATWPGNIDLAPDAMHDEIKKHGQWVLE